MSQLEAPRPTHRLDLSWIRGPLPRLLLELYMSVKKSKTLFISSYKSKPLEALIYHAEGNPAHCLRFANPAEATWCLEAKFRNKEIGGLGDWSV